MLTLAEIVEQMDAVYRGPERPLKTVRIDSRKVMPGDLFVAVRGNKVDGHDFIPDAIDRGARVLMVDRPIDYDIAQIIVPDTTKGLGQFARIWREQFSIPLIAITGSCGKTSTKSMVAAILSEIGDVCATPGNYNSEYGLPLSLLQLNPSHQFGVFELGTNSPGEIQTLTEIAQPTIATILNIHHSHLVGLKSLDGVSHEKSDIFNGLKANGIAVINLDEPYHALWEHKLKDVARVTFSRESEANVTAHDVAYTSDGVTFRLQTPIGTADITIPLLGNHVVSNALAAISCALSAGAQLDAVVSGLKRIKPVSGRMELMSLGNGARLINDTYNGIADAVERAMEALSAFEGRRIMVMTSMGELGDYAMKLHAQMGEWAKRYEIDHLLLMGDEALLSETLHTAGSRASYFESQQALLSRLVPLIDENTTVLVKGGRAFEMERVVTSLLEAFSHAVVG